MMSIFFTCLFSLSTFTTSITSYVRLGSSPPSRGLPVWLLSVYYFLFLILLFSESCRSFYQPWKDLTSEPTDLEKMDELHACQSLLVVISNFLGKKSLDAPFLSHQDVENSGVYKWERSIIETESHSRQNPSV